MEELLMQMQASKKAQEAQVQKRRAILRIAVILLIILLALRILGVAQGGLLPVGVAIAEDGSARAAASAPAALARVEWLSYCDAARVGLGVYSPTDIPCSPSRIVSFPALQAELTTAGLLASGEYLAPAAAPLSPACRVTVVTEATAQVSGWLCADVNGLYWTDASGQNPGAHWQAWSDGSWASSL